MASGCCCRALADEDLVDAPATGSAAAPKLGLFEHIKHLAFGPDFLILRSSEEDAAFREKTDHCRDPSTDKAPVRGGAALADAGTVQVEVTMAQDGSKSKAKESKEKAAEQKIVYAVPCDDPIGPAVKQEFKTRKVYNKVDELSLLPFTPPSMVSYATSMLAGTFKVFQYVVTVMVALMVMQHAVERYWVLQGTTSRWQDLLFVVFISYPAITLLLVVLTNSEMAIRRFMYYRMMSLRIIIDWENTPIWRMWFFAYFAASFAILAAYGFFAGWLTREDMTVSLYPQLSIIAMQSVLLFMFWNTIVHMEDQLVPLNKVIENSPHHAKDLITHCTVVTEKQFKNMLQDVYKRKCRFKYASWAVKCAAGNALHENSAAPVLLNKKAVHADFFDLEGLRNNEVEKAVLGKIGFGYWLHNLDILAHNLVWDRIYALYFAHTYLWSVHMYHWRRWKDGCQHATMWPYPRDAIYFRLLAVLSSLCWFAVFAIEAYGIWFVVFANENSVRDKYGVLECKMCYNYHAEAAETCRSRAQNATCWDAVKLGYCSFTDTLLNKFNVSSTELANLAPNTCRVAGFLPATA